MKFNSITFSRYDLDLDTPLINFNSTYKKRTGYIIVLCVDNFFGYGEASPLPFFSNNSKEKIPWILEELRVALEKNQEYDKEDIFLLFQLYSGESSCLNFALDMALYDILSQKEKIPLSKYLNKNAMNCVEFSELYNDRVISLNSTIKIKLICKDAKEDAKYIKQISKKLKKGTLLRLDANKKFSLNQAILFCELTENLNIEYIEEPLLKVNHSSLKKLKNETNRLFAFDESIIDRSIYQFISKNLVDFIILKPPLYGNIEDIFALQKHLNEHHVKLILSSSMQTQIGNLCNIHLAAAMTLNYKHGLNNYSFFNYNTTIMPYSKDDSNITLDGMIGLGVTWND